VARFDRREWQVEQHRVGSELEAYGFDPPAGDSTMATSMPSSDVPLNHAPRFS